MRHDRKSGADVRVLSRMLTVLSLRFAGGKGSLADRPPGRAGSLESKEVNETPYPTGNGVNTREECAVKTTLRELLGHSTQEIVRVTPPRGTIQVCRAGPGYLLRLKMAPSLVEKLYPCATRGEVLRVLRDKLGAPDFALVGWAFLGKVF